MLCSNVEILTFVLVLQNLFFNLLRVVERRQLETTTFYLTKFVGGEVSPPPPPFRFLRFFTNFVFKHA